MGATFDVTAILKANVSDFSRGLKEAQMSLESFRNQTGCTGCHCGGLPPF